MSTRTKFELDGNTQDFEITFEYLARRFVFVRLVNEDGSRDLLLENGIDYQYVDKTHIHLEKAWGLPDGYSHITIQRITSPTDRVATFFDGTILKSNTLNLASIQPIHIAEEATDSLGYGLVMDNSFNYDFKNHKGVNVGDPTDPKDAVNVDYLNQTIKDIQSGEGIIQFEKGLVKFYIDVYGDLIVVHNSDDNPPPLHIDNNGDLIYEFKGVN